MKRRLVYLLFVLALALSLSTAVSAQDNKLKPAGQPEVISIITGTADKDTASPSIGRESPAGLQRVSVILVFEGPVDANKLAADNGGQIVHRYSKVFNGVSMLVSPDKVEDLAAVANVTLYPDEVLHIDTEESPQFIGAPAMWSQLGGQDSAGEGVVVGVIDTGIWPEHPSFSDPDPEGKPYAAPPGGPYACDFGNTAWNPDDVAFTCNNKLIGAYEFLDTYKFATGGLDPKEFDSARDSDGHGSHTSSTAAGNMGVDASILGTDFGKVSGVAPRAHIIMYRVCAGETGSCYSSDSAAAVEQAILDGVDVLNFSIGGGSSPYSDVVSLAFLSAYESGIFVAASAGNSGPGADTVAHREPWVTTVAASTQSRTFRGTIDLEADNFDTLHLDGVSIGGSVIDGEVVIGADYGDALCGSVDGINPFAPATFTSNQIVVCRRGTTARVEKSANVQEAGAGGMILYNPSVNTLDGDNHFIPTVHISNTDGTSLLSFLAAHTGVTATLAGGVKVYESGDIMAAFSSRGGPGQSLGISKPDISAPGVNILAAHTPKPAFPIGGGAGAPGNLFHAIGGTSMSSPHIAGSGALMKALHPTWTPGQIKSALMMSATPNVLKEDGLTDADPFDFGSGRVDLAYAGIAPGLTISDSGANYFARMNDLWNSNYPSLYIPVMPGIMTVQRTVHSELPTAETWSLTVDAPPDLSISVPANLAVGAGGNATISITIDASLVPIGQVRHATLFFNHGSSILRFPITIVRKQPSVSLDKTCDPTDLELGEVTECIITAVNYSFEDADVIITDPVPSLLKLNTGSVVGGTASNQGVITWIGSLAATQPPDVAVVDGTGMTPGGYLPLSLFGIAPISGVSDETIINYTVPAFEFAGKTWNKIGMVSNGYAVVGGGDASDIDYVNQVFPDPTRPNNVLAPFWTDLNPGSTGKLRVGILTDGVNDWLVLDWEGVQVWSDNTDLNSFQIWIGLNGYEDISFTYGVVGSGDGGYLTVGAENEFGNKGDNWYVDGTGTPVSAGNELLVVSTPGGPGGSHTISFTAEAKMFGDWMNCSTMTSPVFAGTNIACVTGYIAPAAVYYFPLMYR